MTEILLDFRTWGNNSGVHLPAAIAREAIRLADSWRETKFMRKIKTGFISISMQSA